MDVSIIIVNYNTFNLTLQCIESIYQYTKELEYEVLLVDNASPEGNIELVTTVFPSIKLIKSDVNLGFAGGNNLGISYASGKYIILLNSDTYLKDNAILATCNYMEEHSKVGVLSPRLVFENGKHQSAAQRFPSLKYQLIELFRLQKLVPKKIAGRILLGPFFDCRSTVKVDWVWGTFFMFRKKILAMLPAQKLDDSYFMYCEDMQWCKDIKKLGYEIHFCAETEVVHMMGGSSGAKKEMMLQNGELFLQKNYSKLEIKWIKILAKWLQR